MVDGEIHYARFPLTLDSNGFTNGPVVEITTIFPTADYDNVVSKIVPISGGRGRSNAVMVVFARRIT